MDATPKALVAIMVTVAGAVAYSAVASGSNQCQCEALVRTAVLRTQFNWTASLTAQVTGAVADSNASTVYGDSDGETEEVEEVRGYGPMNR